MDPPELSASVRTLVERGVVFDAHVDAIGRAVDLGHDLGVRGTEGHFDLVRAQEGGLGTWVVVLWVDPELYLERPFARAALMLRTLHELARRHARIFRLVGNARELKEGRHLGAVCGIASIEGGHAIEEDLGKLEWFFDHGLRGMTLVWNNHLPWIRSCQDGAGSGVPKGINEFGREVVLRMNYLGMLIDVSHAGERAFHDVISASAHPVVASHSGCRALHDHPRNLTDDQLKALAKPGGVCGIVFHPGFLDAGAREEELRVRDTKAYKNRPGSSEAERFLRAQEIMRREAEPLPLERLVDHVAHVAEVAGVEHVGLGSDFDGIEHGPQWCEDASGYGVLAELLSRRGFSSVEVELILGGNFRRVFAHVTGQETIASKRHVLPMEPSTPSVLG